jgi:ribonuclease J
MIELIRPRAFIPVHGTRHHLERHAEVARELGVSDVLVIENGSIAEVESHAVRANGQVTTGRVATWQGLPIADEVLRERRSLARAGVLSIGLAIDARGRLASPPSVVARGVLEGEQDGATVRFVAVEIAKALENGAASRDDTTLAELARLAARRAVESKTGKKPVCLVSVVRV